MIREPWRTPEQEWWIEKMRQRALKEPLYRRARDNWTIAKLRDASSLGHIEVVRPREPSKARFQRVVDGVWVAADGSYYLVGTPEVGYRVVDAA